MSTGIALFFPFSKKRFRLSFLTQWVYNRAKLTEMRNIMKKLMYIELAVLAVLVVVAIIACATLTKPTFSPDSLETSGNATTESTTAPTTEATEPAPTWKTYPADRQLLAQQYFVYDCKANTFLVSSGTGSERIYPASITKLFTAYVAMQYVEPETEITPKSFPSPDKEK